MQRKPEPGTREKAPLAGRMSAPVLSFCIPVMNRLADLRETLEQNLEDNRSAAGRVEFVVACFDRDDTTEHWVRERFARDLGSGYLRFERCAPLPFWHFGRAKNAFRNLMHGQIYASLDGDNFTGPGAADHIISVFERFNHRCVFHQFQGQWGDGTCGRIAMPRAEYELYGYDERFLPRQWDEMDALLSTLSHRPDFAYVCYHGKGVFRKSPHFRRFFKDHQRRPRICELPAESNPGARRSDPAAAAQRGADYVSQKPLLIEFSNYNQYQSFFKNTDQEPLRTRYAAELVSIGQKLVRTADPEQLERWVLEPGTRQPGGPLQDGVTVLACLKNEPDPEAWYRHYRSLGARRFLLVDDGSEQPLSRTLAYDDVHIWTPRVGRFRYAKTLWLETLLARYCQDGWCLTVDGDEFIALPSPGDKPESSDMPLDGLVRRADKTQKPYYCGFLLDLFPGTAAGRCAREDHDHYQYRDEEPPREYLESPPVRWSYGAYGAWAFRLDLRYRLNDTVDSLRKFPLFRYHSQVHLNQGFHDLLIDGKGRRTEELARADLLPILHYKLWNMQQKCPVTGEGTALPDAPDYSAYHERTRQNLERLEAGLDQHIEAAAASDRRFRFIDYGLVPVPGAPTISVHRSPPSDHNQDPVGRHRGFYFDGPRADIRLNGFALTGPDFEAVIEWLRVNTPYRTVEETRSDRVTLRAWPDPSERSAVKTRLRLPWRRARH